MTTREQLEQEAAELYPGEGYATRQRQRAAYIQGRTISAEQLEKAAEAIGLSIDGLGWDSPEAIRDAYLQDARSALRAAGFYVEES